MATFASARYERHSFSRYGKECRSTLLDVEIDLVRLANEPQFKKWCAQIERVGGCERPVYLAGRIDRFNSAGFPVAHYDTSDEPGGRIAVRCRNRRASQCSSCSYIHAGDSYQIVRSGMVGGKGTPETVNGHPQVFVTLTAPSFGPVHRANAHPCRVRAANYMCQHGRALYCSESHNVDDEMIGSPLCTECYDYSGQILWHAHAGELWNRTIRNVRRFLSGAAGIKRSCLNDHVRLTFAKVAEYQRRGAIHFHAVMRLDGPEGTSSIPPDWATVGLLQEAVRAARSSSSVHLKDNVAVGARTFSWGRQIDVRSLDGDTERPVTGGMVAAYLAKYVSKSVGDSGGVDSPIRSYEEIRCASASPHMRSLMGACWRIGGIAEFSALRLRAWAHTLGYRGHALTKSPGYSTTYGRLREVRAEYVRARKQDSTSAKGILKLSSWRYVGRGYTLAEQEVAAGIRHDLQEIQRLKRWGL
ncbi:replication initiator [Streptomyces sp. NPDC088729]|uniref:replication initiator n=1 Tax=Streptomyces sp. NPDC088729 TaxID=3365876 RepID=UPI0037F5E2FE